MDHYIYAADQWCVECGEAIRERITAEGKAPPSPDNEETYDSDDFPKGPFPVEDEDEFYCGSGDECPDYVPSLTRYIDRAERDDLFDAYVKASLFDSTDNATEQGGEPLDRNFDRDDIDAATLSMMREDCDKFFTANLDHIREGEFDDQASQAGYDFWMTRNESGVGFWDGDWPDEAGEALTEASKGFGRFELYVGDDGKIHGI